MSETSKASERTTLVGFKNAPFPYHESANTQLPPFFDVVENGERGHSSIRGGIYWEKTTYSDNRVLLAIPPQLNLDQNPLIIVYFHGNQSTLERDVRDRQQIPQQLTDAGINALLVAPQLAFDALDSSPGRLTEDGFFAQFLAEAIEQTVHWQRDKKYRQLAKAPVVIVAYSGGYQAAAYALERGGIGQRVAGVILLDALYGHEKSFADWIKAYRQQSFFFSTYTEPAQVNNRNLQSLLSMYSLDYTTDIPDNLRPGTIGFLSLGDDMTHYDLLNHAWVKAPLADLLRRIDR